MKIEKRQSKCSCGNDFTREINDIISKHRLDIDKLNSSAMKCPKCKKNWGINIAEEGDKHILTLNQMN